MGDGSGVMGGMFFCEADTNVSKHCCFLLSGSECREHFRIKEMLAVLLLLLVLNSEAEGIHHPINFLNLLLHNVDCGQAITSTDQLLFYYMAM